MKTYVLTISKNFPSTHSKKGTPTNFFNKIQSGDKKHTIRNNFQFWKKRIDEVNDGKAIISLRQWSEAPYKSKQVELMIFRRGDIGIQKLTIDYHLGYFIDDKDSVYTSSSFAENDGLEHEDFKEWFKKVKYNQDLAIIHFTPDYRY